MNSKTILKTLTMSIIMLSISSCDKKEQKADAYGNFEAKQVTVSSQASGQLWILDVEEGTQARKGEVCGLIDTTDVHLKKLQAHQQYQAVVSHFSTIDAQAAAQRQQLQNLQTDKNRIDQLYREGAATQKQKDDIDGAYALNTKQLEATEAQKTSVRAEAEVILAQLQQLDEQIRKSYITHPIDGIILTKFAESGEVVTFGKPLYKIGNLSTLDLKVYISGNQLADFELGKEVKVTIDQSNSENRILRGTISWISSVAEFTPKTIQTKDERVDLVYAVKVTVKNDGRLKIGMPGEISIIH